MVKLLAILNVAVFVLGLISTNFFALDFSRFLTMAYFQSTAFYPYQILTHFFVHITFMHLAFNMFGLISFGPILEGLWGGKKFLFFYIFCALGSAMLHSGVNFYEMNKVIQAKTEYVANPSPEYFISFLRSTGIEEVENFFVQNNFIQEFEEAPENATNIEIANSNVTKIFDDFKNHYFPKVGGASGAIFGLLVAFGMLFPNTELMLLFIPFPIKAKYFVLIYAGIELFLGVSNYKWDSIAHFAHLGGGLFGFILIKYWQKQRNTFY